MLVSSHIIERNQDRMLERQEAQFDATNSAKQAAESIEFDPIDERIATHATTQMRLAALQVAFMLAGIMSEVDFEDQELLPSELLDSLILEVFVEDPEDDDDEIDPTVKTVLSAHIADAMSTLGVDEDLINDVFDSDIDIADAAIETASEVILENMPADDELDDFISMFAYGDEATYDAMMKEDDEDMYDAAKKPLTVGRKTKRKVGNKTVTYKAVKAVRDGKVTVVNKRIGGNMRLSAAQKAALKKARKKSVTGTAVKKRMMSFAKGLQRNIYNIDPQKARNIRRGLKASHYRRSVGM
ncbi:hypothetical protein [Psychrobacter sp. H7-1]|uniref:hypothetical protein n=1 Tax=Psychrobacter sp. H7-1 TaxID=1569265 RepID=UPI001918D457|nr:hypothetical protein [Psychrobacter sp. H7-1]